MLESKFENLIKNNEIIGETFNVVDNTGIKHEYKIIDNNFEYSSFLLSQNQCYVSSFIAVDINYAKQFEDGRKALFDFMQETKKRKSFNPLIIYEIPGFCCKFYHYSFLDFSFNNGKNLYSLNQKMTSSNWEKIKKQVSYQIEFFKILVRHIGPSLFKELQNNFLIEAKMNRRLSQEFDEKEFKKNFYNTFASSLREYQKSHNFDQNDDEQEYK